MPNERDVPEVVAKHLSVSPTKLLDAGENARIAAASFRNEADNYRFLYGEWRKHSSGDLRKEVLKTAYSDLPEILEMANPLIARERELEEEILDGLKDSAPYETLDDPIAYYGDEVLTGDEIIHRYRDLTTTTEELYTRALQDIAAADEDFYDDIGRHHSGITVMENLPVEHEPRPSFR